jgi:phosphatidylinositol glycan class N
MVLVGVVYLLFEKSLLQRSKMAGDSTAPADNSISRALIGVQVITRFIPATCNF